MAATVHSTITHKLRESVEVPVLTRCCFCFPLRRGLISFAYLNLCLSVVVSCLLSVYMSWVARGEAPEERGELPRLAADTAGLLLELVMTVLFIVALHKKHVVLMKVYLYFEIVFSAVGLVYSLAFLTRETASELFLILFQLTIQIYLVILIWSSIVKMQRDGSVKYVRDHDAPLPPHHPPAYHPSAPKPPAVLDV